MRSLDGYMRGIDLGGWFSQCDHREETYSNFIKEEDFARIRDWGLDHVRLPVDIELFETRDGQRIESGFAHLQRAMDWAEKYGLNLVLDLHKTYGYSFDVGEKEAGFFHDEALQERFCAIWEELARRYGNLHDRVAFELLNEVTDPADGPLWNAIAARCIARVRRIAPETWILIGGYWNNSISALKDLDPPADDRIVYNFHCYDPVMFTHQGAYWVAGMDRNYRLPITVTYRRLAEDTERVIGRKATGMEIFDPDEMLSAAYFEHSMAEAVRVAEERNVPLYCGEYGVINLADPQDTVAWYRMIHQAFEKYGIGRAAWSYRKMDFGLVDEHADPVREELISLL
ncbi:MAG: cellulase family glycosylhydrolase [Clostridia bacterium]|nr:cellulase family glycosylhydrolase [Clostridia bacterium]